MFPECSFQGVGKKVPVAQTFDPQCPNGVYTLEISDPGQRLVAQMLQEMWTEQVKHPYIIKIL
jgi:hypothetical protein